ncbi:MAG: aminotransferase class I/II-fold pyridoxal phosphate-dependent enzyme [Planctomycetes bacterium]|nr:aminotransferase class I/II-fold pyridoxal phosphate-dependent enzyme [Planctomycetota bacterium]
MHKVSDFRSDTVTLPTPEMREAMAMAELGDDVLGTEPTVTKLEKMTADVLGKEAGLFVPSGTMSNQIAMALHCQPGQEIICEFGAHTYNNESGALAYIAHAQVRPVHGEYGVMNPAEVERLIRPSNIHNPRTALISVENTHNAAGGTVIPQENIAALAEVARRHHLKYHLDGARLWNAHVATGMPLKEMCAPFDTVSVCLSKGLCSPVGSVLVGGRDDIERGRYIRKQLGGGMRQSGLLAACGIVSITKMIDRLKDDHANVKTLAEGLKKLKGVELDLGTVHTNIVYFGVPGREKEFDGWMQRLAEKQVLALYLGSRWRMVTHNDVDAEDVQRALAAWQEILD